MEQDIKDIFYSKHSLKKFFGIMELNQMLEHYVNVIKIS